jgi:hypothetical protein
MNKETNDLIESCFKKIKQVDLSQENLNDDQLIQEIHKIIQKEADESNNPYFKMLIKKL